MTLELSILKSTKKILGIDPEDVVFDQDIITHINSAFDTLNDLGIGPTQGFSIEDDSAVWGDFFTDVRRSSIKTYVYVKVQLLFDPPSLSYLLTMKQEQIKEMEQRLSIKRENTSWVDPNEDENPQYASKQTTPVIFDPFCD